MSSVLWANLLIGGQVTSDESDQIGFVTPDLDRCQRFYRHSPDPV